MQKMVSKVYARRFLIVFFVAFAAWFLTFFALRQKPWGADFAICVGYTIFVAGLFYAADHPRNFTRIKGSTLILFAIQHACFLIAAIAVYHFILPWEPSLAAVSSPKLNLGLGIPNLMMVGLAFIEKWLLDRDFNRGSDGAKEESSE